MVCECNYSKLDGVFVILALSNFVARLCSLFVCGTKQYHPGSLREREREKDIQTERDGECSKNDEALLSSHEGEVVGGEELL